ncbi:hypothetical protein [Gallaecimonas sp. GXIMD4217]|uniref:hypothetical protein n=1 Tax=Gallaecimonas sp. GXIMD4217 TaxID=3131927 RepID=UPI00311ACA69
MNVPAIIDNQLKLKDYLWGCLRVRSQLSARKRKKKKEKRKKKKKKGHPSSVRKRKKEKKKKGHPSSVDAVVPGTKL